MSSLYPSTCRVVCAMLYFSFNILEASSRTVWTSTPGSIARWAESAVLVVVRDHMCSECACLTPATSWRSVFTSSWSIWEGVPTRQQFCIIIGYYTYASCISSTARGYDRVWCNNLLIWLHNIQSDCRILPYCTVGRILDQSDCRRLPACNLIGPFWLVHNQFKEKKAMRSIGCGWCFR